MGQVRTSSVAGRELAIAFDNVTKRYGPVQALAGVSFVIERGEMVALLGPNGAGKSTTVDLMLGLRRPDTGSVRILGSAPQQAVEDGRVGAMLQSGSLPERATVSEVVDLARRLYGSQRSLTALLDVAALGDLTNRRTDKLSGGRHGESSSRWRWLATPTCCSSTSRPRGWTSSLDDCSGTASAESLLAGRPSSSPPTTWTKPTQTQAASWSLPMARSSPTAIRHRSRPNYLSGSCGPRSIPFGSVSFDVCQGCFGLRPTAATFSWSPKMST